MKRRGFLVLVGSAALLALGSTPLGLAQTSDASATRTQIDLALAAASLAALRTRYGETYVDVVAAHARIAALSEALRAARARHDAIDVAEVTRVLDAELADTRTRLGERSSRCGAGHPEMDSARAREVALTDAIAHVTSDGFFLP